ncbi:MAG: hypothetical protein ACLGHY_01015 [Gammaproteobacteria bacterium]
MTTVADKIESAGEEAGSTLRKLKKFDEERPGFPGEHLLVFAVGSLLMLAARRSRSPLRRVLMMTAGTAFMGRAASGKGGVARLASVLGRL